MGGAVSTGGFQLQFQNFMYYAGPIVQILFWVVLGVAAIWATLIFKRYVDFMMGKTPAAKAVASKSVDDVAVEEFVD